MPLTRVLVPPTPTPPVPQTGVVQAVGATAENTMGWPLLSVWLMVSQ
jgi:hypothetical protein